MPNYITAIKLLSPNAIVAGVGSTLDTLVFQHNPDNLTHEQIQEKLEELQAAEPMRLLREERNRKLQETDWWAAGDRIDSMTNEQKIYRKQLRDLPSTASPELDENGQLSNVTWPTKPE